MLHSKVEFDPNALASDNEIISASVGRVAIRFFAPQTGSVTLSNEPIAAFGQGLILSSGGQPIQLRLDVDGDCVQRAWKAFYSAGATGISWIQTLG